MSQRIWFRAISAFVSLTLAATVAGQAAAASTRSSAIAPVATAAEAKVTERPDRVSAMVSARTQKSRVEDLSARTPTTATYANPDGTWTVEAHSGVVRSKSDADSWVPVDSSVEKQGGAFEPKATPFDAEFSDGGDKTIGSVSASEDSSIEVGWPTKLPAPQVEGNRLTYPGAAPNADLVVDSQPAGFSYSVVLDQAPATGAAPIEYRIPLKFEGVTAEVRPSGAIVLKDGKNRIATMTAPVMWDDANKADDGERHPVTATVEGEGSARTLVLKPDMDFLRDPSTTYPVTVDPTVSLNVAYDTWVDSTSPTSSQISSTELRVGSNNSGTNIDRSYLYFDLTQLSSMPAAAVSSAELQVSNFETGACSGSAVRMSQVTGAYNIATMTWATQPTTTATGSATSTGSFGATGCTSEGTMAFDATAIFTSWLTGSFNWGLQLKADSETAASGFRKLRSAENGDVAKAPKLVLTYNSYPYKATGLSFSPGNTTGSTNYVTSLTPTLSAVVTDPDGGQVRGYFEIRDSSGSTMLWSGNSGWTTSGGQVTIQVPTTILTHGSTYQVRAYSRDAALKSLTYQTRNMVVDTSAPAVTITSTGYTNNTWTAPAPSSNNFTFDGPTDTATFDAVLDGVPTTLYANSSGDFSFPMTYVAQWHTYQVTAIDKAGNRGAVSTFSFGSGAPGFTVPQQNQSTTSTFPLDISAPPNATGATLNWKLQGETTWRSMGSGTVTKAGSSWAGAVSTSGGRTGTGDLLWKAISEEVSSGVNLEAPALLNLRACFQYTASADKCTYARTLQLVPSAFGGNFPTASLGPATVALFTGEASINGVDAADSKSALGRSFSSYDRSTLTSGVFGPGWSEPDILAGNANVEAGVIDNRSKDGTFVIVEPDSGSQVFVSASGSATSFVPLEPTGDATVLTYTPGSGGQPDTLELTRPLGADSVRTKWTLRTSDMGGDPAWIADSVDAPGTASDTVITSTSQRPTFVRESDPSAASTCTATTQTVGCRGLKMTYTGTGSATRLASVAKVIGAATQSAVTTVTIASYAYDGSGRLNGVCTPVPAAGKPTLCTTYAYTTVAGRTVISEVQPAGLKKWRLNYDTTGRLINVKRERPTGGDATWSVDYGLTPSSNGLPDLSAATAGQWGQQTIPTKVFAVYKPYTGTADVSKAELLYTTGDGMVTNTASYGPSGWLVDTNWYDANGNVVQELDSTGWARVQASAATDRPRVAAEASSYTIYNTWGGSDVAGTRVVDEYGPAHSATLKDGTTGLFRTHTQTMYDDDPAVDTSLIANRPGSTGLGLVVKKTRAVSNATRSIDFDGQVTKYGYDPVVSGDPSGWTLGLPTTASTQVDASSWSTATTRYDASGREIESRRPGGAADSSGAGTDALSSRITYYTAGGSGDCGGKPAWDGMLCKVEPAGQPTGPTVPSTYVNSYNLDLQATSVLEVSGGVVARTSTGTFDDIGRATGMTKQTTGSGVANETIATTYEYDDNTGLATTTTSGGKTVTTGYDTWGRGTSYTDALGTTSATTYDAAGDIATFNDGSGTYTYSYDSHGWFAGVDAGGGVGSFTYAYSPAGDVDSITYPNGVVAKRTYDELGIQTGLTYKQGSTDLLAFTTTAGADGRTSAQSSVASAQQFTFDGLERLIKVSDTRNDGCATRTYGFDAASNRSGFASYAPAATTSACQTTTATVTESNTYDAAGRIRNSGYTYDTLGRTLTTPQVDAGSDAAGALTATYHADDMVASLSQSVINSSGGTDAKVMSYGLDPAERIQSVTTTVNGSEASRLRYRFADESDAPAVVESSMDAGNTWNSTRYVTADFVGVAASVSNGTTTIQLTNMAGSIVATMSSTIGSSTIGSYSETDEFGNRAAGATSARYDWLGTKQRSRDSLGGVVLMGSRSYNPSTGLFLSVDPVEGGNLTAYTYPQDPINMTDLDGRWCPGCGLLLKAAWKGAMKALSWGLGKVACATTTAAAIICSGVIGAIVASVDYVGWKMLNGDDWSWSKLGEKAIDGFISGIGGKSAIKKAAKPWKKYGRGIVEKMLDAAKSATKKVPKGGTVAKVIDKIGSWLLRKLDGVFA